ncbi:hypothetical protein [Acetobacterium bakii]|uniref:hypothetical protein n=1 Tax=Acetobacterium bakii TaxID=52689 RepID=UPI000F8D24FC|nr:hypothetical protein [Acetobacterium bakii]
MGAFSPPKMLHEGGVVREAMLSDVINFLKLTQSSVVINKQKDILNQYLPDNKNINILPA